MKMHRLFAIVYLLLEQKRMTAHELAEHFEVSTRTIYRDVEVLAEAGIPIYASQGSGGGIFLAERFVLDKSVLTDEEQQGILSALQGLRAVRKESAEAALDKLSALFGGQQEEWIEVDYDRWNPHNIVNARFAQLRTAIFERRLVTFDYISTQGVTKGRTVEPMKLVFRGHDWYLLAWCWLREDYRFFKLTRMVEIVVTEEVFLRRHLPEQVSRPATEISAEPMTIRVAVSPEAIYRLQDDFCPLKLRPREDGWLEVQLEVTEGAWLYEYLLTYGDALEVLAPTEVRQALYRRLKNAWQRYEI